MHRRSPRGGDKKAKDTATSPSAAKAATAALPVRCQTTTSPAQTGSGSATSNAPMEVKQLEADEPIFAENQAQWEQLTKEISWNQGLLSGVKSMAGEDVEQRRQELQTQLTDLFTRRTNLKNAPQRVSTLTGVIKRVEVKKEAAATQLVDAEKELEAATRKVESIRS